MAGFYETLLGNLNIPVESYTPNRPAAVFGNAATTPANIEASNAKINSLRQLVARANDTLTQQQNAYNKAYKSYQQQLNNYNRYGGYGYYGNRYYGNEYTGRLSGNEYYGDRPFIPVVEATAPTAPSQTALNNARTALTTAQTKLDKAIANQAMQAVAGKNAVAQGLAAKTAEEQGIANAAQMYQQAMQGEAVRNAIMNNAIGAAGGFGGVR